MTTDQLAQVFPRASPSWLVALAEAMPKYDINTHERVAAFLGQLGHESMGLTVFEENLYYSAERLMAVWPTRFQSLEEATKCAKNSRALANNVYANRMGNGAPASGDGYRYRGRGPIQITGKSNYLRFGLLTGYPIAESPDAVSNSPDVGCAVACAYWQDTGCNPLADEGNHWAITRKINGGTHGLRERLAWVAKASRVT